MVAVLLPDIFRDVMPGNTAGVMQLFAAGDEGLAQTLLRAARASDIYGEPSATPHDLEVFDLSLGLFFLSFFGVLELVLLRHALYTCIHEAFITQAL